MIYLNHFSAGKITWIMVDFLEAQLNSSFLSHLSEEGMDGLVLGIIIILKSGPFWHSTQLPSFKLLCSEKVGDIHRKEWGCCCMGQDENILSRYLKFLLNHFKYEENKSICFYVRSLTFEVFEFYFAKTRILTLLSQVFRWWFFVTVREARYWI